MDEKLNGDDNYERTVFFRTEGIPVANIHDMRDGAERIPEEVTKAREKGETVTFVLKSNGSYH